MSGGAASDPVLAMLESSPPIAGDRPLSGRVVRIAAKKISDLAEVRVLSTAPIRRPWKFLKIKTRAFPGGRNQTPFPGRLAVYV